MSQMNQPGSEPLEMSLRERLEQARRAQQAEAERARQEALLADARTRLLKDTACEQRGLLAAQYEDIVAERLTTLARAAWGDNRYTIFSPTEDAPLHWVAVRVEGKNQLNYTVTLVVSEKDLKDSGLKPTDPLIRASYFVVTGEKEFRSGPSPEELEKALTDLFQSGPRNGGLREHIERLIAESPYKDGEYDERNEWLCLLAVINIVAGCVVMVVPPSLLDFSLLWGILLIALGGSGLVLTSFGRRFRRLPIERKVGVIFGSLPAAGLLIAGFGMILLGLLVLAFFGLILWLAGEALDQESERSEKVSQIEEGVRRALRK